jgi:CBS domain-containing protein
MKEGGMKVREIMTAQPKTASRNTTLAAAAQLLWGADCGILPVVDDGKLVGVVTDRDMYVALATRNTPASQVTIGDVATNKVWACGPDDDVHVALDTMASQRVRRLPVTQDGALVGVLSLNDLVLAAGADKAVRNDEVVATLKAICAHPAAPAAAAA